MRKKTLYSLIIVFLFLPTKALIAQGGEIDTQKKIFHRNEKTASVGLNTNGWGINYRYGKRIDASKKWLYDADFNVMKHQKEQKMSSDALAGGRFVYGKDNYAFNLQASFGRQKEFFRKQDKGSISLRGFYLAGVTLAVMKPIYYEVQVTEYQTVDQRFEPSLQPFYIVGRASLLKGIPETTAVPGLYAKGGVSFEFSRQDQKVRSFDIGMALNVYPKEIKIMAEIPNSQVFPTVFLSFRFGKVVSGHSFDETKKNMSSE